LDGEAFSICVQPAWCATMMWKLQVGLLISVLLMTAGCFPRGSGSYRDMPSLALSGIGAWENDPHYTMLEWIETAPQISWYYNWRTDQMWHEGGQERSVEFVPMIRRAEDVGEPIRSDLPVRALLGFNEPDGSGPGKSNLSVERAIALWPQLEAYGLRLGSPATRQSGTLGPASWQRRFMDKAKANGLRVDFMAVHYYSTDGDVRAFRRWLHAVHAEYGLPIWVTEFAVVDWDNPSATTYARNIAFAEAAVPMLDSLPFVERHAWFSANPYRWNGVYPELNLLQNDLRQTPLGAAYEALLKRQDQQLMARAKQRTD
jgi:hypothetical protein